ncbi:hypothetical protein [Streptomyces sp. NPDC020681]|uniref:SCO2400 family protein n=1 Tax=Streptomyces sp. NPDC020681 TaxID=3365083 RepID=UPI0037B9A54F
MDYCHQCRRHLNGALACAGCGTPVEELRHQSPSAPASEHVYELDEVSEPAGHRRSRRQAPQRRKPAGRRGKKRRGRKVLIGTFGLVLAAGALSLAELAMENPGDDGAATSVKEETEVEIAPLPEPTDEDTPPELPDGVTEKPVATATKTARPSGSGSGAGAGAGRPTGTAAGDGPPAPTSSAAQPSSSASPSASGGPSPSSSGQPSTGPAAPPPPAPTPTETCNQFLWWCI